MKNADKVVRDITPCARCGKDDILDDATGLCMTCHVIEAFRRGTQ
jgi:hypothetical protein